MNFNDILKELILEEIQSETQEDYHQLRRVFREFISKYGIDIEKDYADTGEYVANQLASRCHKFEMPAEMREFLIKQKTQTFLARLLQESKGEKQ